MIDVRTQIRKLMKEGVYHQDSIYQLLYPNYPGHYSRLRAIIAEEKNNA